MDDFLEHPLVFLDLESTGIKISQDRIVEIALIKIYEGAEIERFHTYVNPGMLIPEEVIKVHGINNARVAGCPMFGDIAQEVFNFVKGCDIAGHQIMRFDLPMLVEELLRAGLPGFPFPGMMFIDTYSNQEKIFPRTLKFCYESLTCKPFDDSQAHGAMYDTECSKEIYLQQVGRFSDTLGNTREHLHALATRGKTILDFDHKLRLNDSGMTVVWNFGKNEGKRVTGDLSYIEWVLKSDFTEDTKRWVNYCIKFHDDYPLILKSRI